MTLKWILGVIIILGIAYRFVLPYTPIWLDIVSFVIVLVSFLVLLYIGRRN
jgi:hypothetical protein